MKDANNQGVYIVVLCVCRTTLSNKEKVYALKLSDVPVGFDAAALMSGEVSMRKRTSIFRRKSNRAYYDASPLNAVRRKH